MKLKLTAETNTLINDIVNTADTVSYDAAIKLIRTYEKDLKAKDLPAKQYAKLRRELSFVYELMRLSYTRNNGDNSLVLSESVFIQRIRDLHSADFLKSVSNVQLALQYGALQLSDYEIGLLISNNNV